MNKLLALPLMAALTTFAPLAVRAESGKGFYSAVVEGSFDDVAFAVEQAIINEGLVIDLRSHVGEMLSRTKEDVGGKADTVRGCECVLILLGHAVARGDGGGSEQSAILPLWHLCL